MARIARILADRWNFGGGRYMPAYLSTEDTPVKWIITESDLNIIL